jgi:co-chaperonin GroES (HSP10)
VLTKYGKIQGAGLDVLYRPTGHVVIVAPDPVKEATQSGIILTKDTVKDDAAAQTYGTVLAMGPECFVDLAGVTKIFPGPDGEQHRLKKATALFTIGDRVLYQRYTGLKIPGPDGELRQDIVLLNEQDISAVVVGESEIPELPDHLKLYLKKNWR